MFLTPLIRKPHLQTHHSSCSIMLIPPLSVQRRRLLLLRFHVRGDVSASWHVIGSASRRLQGGGACSLCCHLLLGNCNSPSKRWIWGHQEIIYLRVIMSPLVVVLGLMSFTFRHIFQTSLKNYSPDPGKPVGQWLFLFLIDLAAECLHFPSNREKKDNLLNWGLQHVKERITMPPQKGCGVVTHPHWLWGKSPQLLQSLIRSKSSHPAQQLIWIHSSKSKVPNE